MLRSSCQVMTIIHNTSVAQYPKHDLAQTLYTKIYVLLNMAEKATKKTKQQQQTP